jgi:ABC-2 type transport system ATP-binding protein
MSLAVTEEVTRRFGAIVAVDGVSLRVDESEVVGLLGANGAGKTTLIRCLLGVLPPTAGRVALFGQAPSRRTRQDIGYMPQSLGLYEDLSVEQNLAFVSTTFGAPVPFLTPDLVAVRSVPVREVSLGLRRRAAFAAALSHRPRLLVLDEPTSGVDPLARAGLWETIRAAADGGAGVLVTTHHLDEAEHCDRLVVLTDGRVAAEGTIEDILRGATVAEVRATDWAPAFTALDDAGHPLLLAGRRIRVPGIAPEEVRATLDRAGVEAEVTTAPASLDEVLLAGSR